MTGTRTLAIGALAGLHFAVATPVHAAFHLWRIQEIYTDPAGSIQFVELFTPFAGQQFVNGHAIRSSNGSALNEFIFPHNSGPTRDRHLLLATPGFEAACGVTPDYIIPEGFLFAPEGDLNFVGASRVTYTTLPAGGALSPAGDGVTIEVNSPTHFAGRTTMAGWISCPTTGHRRRASPSATQRLVSLASCSTGCLSTGATTSGPFRPVGLDSSWRSCCRR